VGQLSGRGVTAALCRGVGDDAYPAGWWRFGRRGARLALFPLMKVYRRLTVGEEEDLRAFYAMVTDAGRAAQVN